MSFTFTPENKKIFDDLLTKYPVKQAALLPALWLAQKQNKYISDEAKEYIAGLLGLTPAEVHGVMTFYTMYKDKPIGKYHLQICRTLSCALRGAETIIDHVQNKLKIKPGQTTPDGLFSIELVECLASCGTAPAIQINEAYCENLTTEKVDQILDKLV